MVEYLSLLTLLYLQSQSSIGFLRKNIRESGFDVEVGDDVSAKENVDGREEADNAPLLDIFGCFVASFMNCHTTECSYAFSAI
jgi:hypothetical protein